MRLLCRSTPAAVLGTTVGIWAIWCGCILAQEEPPPCRQEALKQWAFLEGQWDVVTRYRLPDGTWDTSFAHSQISRELEGCLWIERFFGTRAGKPISARGAFAFNAEAGKLQKVWVDTEQGALVALEGGSDSLGVRLHRELAGPDLTVTVEHLYSQIHRHSFLLEGRRSDDRGTTWEVAWTARYRRAP